MFEVETLELAKQFLLDLEQSNPKLRSKALWTIGLLETRGEMLGMPYSRLIEGTNGKLKELRVQQASNICRLFYFKSGDKYYIITSGYIKKTDKTSPQEIARALRLMEEYNAETKNNTF